MEKCYFTFRKVTLLVLLLLTFTGTTLSQPQYYNFNASTSGNLFPFNQPLGKMVQWLVAPGEFNQPMGAPPGNITSFSIMMASTGSRTFTNMYILMAQTTAITLPTSSFYTDPMDTVYFRASVSLSSTLGQWMTITLDTPFPYDPAKSLVVQIEQCGATGTGMNVAQTNLTGFRRCWSLTSSPCPWAFQGQQPTELNCGIDVSQGGNTFCFIRNGLWKSIPDNNTGGAADTINVTGNSGVLDDITVIIDTVIHTWIGDLVFDLYHETQTDTLFAWIGTGTFGNSSENLFGIRLTDSATTPLVSVGSGTPPPGSYLPGGRTGVDSLKKHFVRFGGAPSDIHGLWILNMHDRAGGDTGSLRAWGICFYSGNVTQIISNNNQLPSKYALGQNYPNPFNPSTKIKFSIPKAGLVNLKVYDILGREVQTLVNKELTAGEFIVDFDGTDLASGTYFYRIQAGDFVEVKKMVLLK